MPYQDEKGKGFHNPPVIIAGMHRSGTSWISSILSDSGLNLGESLLPADRNNKKGYFEDLIFLDLNRKILNSCFTSEQGGFPDWGWSRSPNLDFSKLYQFETEALELIKVKSSQGCCWGWKDPRNTVLLDFWNKIIPEALYVFVYRFPWEVADSMQRLGAPEFLEHPGYAYKIWTFYNRLLLDFYHRHKDRSLLVSSNYLSLHPVELGPLLKDKLGLSLQIKRGDQNFDPQLFKSSFNLNAARGLIEIAFPEIKELLLKLEEVADLGSRELISSKFQLKFNREWQDKSNKPILSILIPCFNQGIFLLDALISVESYAPSATEVLIVNDGSNDAETLEILHHLSQAGYTIINQANVGLSTTRNRLAALAKADIILPLDADNRILPEFIEQGLQVFASQPQMGVVYGDRLDFGLRNNIVNVPEFDLGLLLKGNYIDACALIRKQVINDCDGYDPHLQALEDWELWIHAVAKGWQFAKLPLTCFEYRVRPNSMVSALQNPEFLDNCMQYVQHKHHELYSPWLREKVLHLEGEIQSLNSRFALLETQRVQQEQILEQIINSRSWRITAPLRKVLLYFRNLVNHKC